MNRKLAIGATGLLLLGGAGGAVAVAATQGSSGSGRQAYVDDVAKRLNVSPGSLTAAMKAARLDRIQAAVAAGRITQAQADALKQRVEQGGRAGLLGHRFGGPGGGLHHIAAQYLGISAATLTSDRQAGKSLAQIAASTPGKSVDGLKAAIVAAERARLQAAVSSGSITSQQEQKHLSRLSSRIEALLARTGAGGTRAGSGLAPPGHP
jgi:hypothetical protein